MDEQNHLSRGAAFLFTGDPRLSVEHPPLVNTLSALPLLTLEQVNLPTDRPSWNRQPPDIFWYLFANEFLWEYNHTQVNLMIFLARLPIVFLTLALALVGFVFGNRLWGRPAGLLAFVFLLFDPNILAHGRYITTDLGGTAFLLLATAVIWQQWQRPFSWRGTLLMALTMGLAFTSKLLTLGFVPIWIIASLLPLYPHKGFQSGLGRLLQLLTAGLISIFVVWVIFGFEWGAFLFLSDELTWLNSYSGPMPTFWSGIERILLLGGGGRSSYLLGEFSTEGFLLYFPIAFLAKTPLLTLILFPLTAAWLIWRPETRQRALFLLLLPLLYFGLSMTSALNIGYRHLLPTLPFVYLLIAGGVSSFKFQVSRSRFRNSSLIPHPSSFIPFLFLIPTLLIHPHYLSYFNRAAGGPRYGQQILIDSNIDWGQDLFRLQAWMQDNGVESVKLGWFGSARPDYYGLPNEPLPGFPLPEYLSLWSRPPFNTAAPEPGIYALSVSSLQELTQAEKTTYAWFRNREPDEMIGYSIYIYRVGEQ